MINQVIALPKSLFLNICGLNKTKHRVRAFVALAADLKTMDVDVSIISETHLCEQIPDTVVGVDGYNIYRRDRDWGNGDKRKNGGVATFVRNHLEG